MRSWRDSGQPSTVAPQAVQHILPDLPNDTLMYLLGSRYCETDRFSELAWSLFKDVPPGWGRVQAICDFVHRHIEFGYQHARSTKTAWDTHMERQGVCRDFAHLAITLCRCMNIPARYCTGYLGDIGVPADPAPMDFSAWRLRPILGGRLVRSAARHNVPRINRIGKPRGRDATDVALSTAFRAEHPGDFQGVVRNWRRSRRPGPLPRRASCCYHPVAWFRRS